MRFEHINIWLQEHTASLKRIFFSLVFPPTCIGCEQEYTWWCEFCYQLSLEKIVSSKNTHKLKRLQKKVMKDNPHIKRVFTLGIYTAHPILQKAIKALKYKNAGHFLALPLGKLLARAYLIEQKKTPNQLKYHPEICVIPVPLHSKKQSQRSYNQSQLIAQAFCAELKASQLKASVHSSILKRVYNTKSQVQVSNRTERLKNLENAFEVNSEYIISPYTEYLLLDDVCTTGSTLEACSQVLSAYGFTNLSSLSLVQS